MKKITGTVTYSVYWETQIVDENYGKLIYSLRHTAMWIPCVVVASP